MNQSEIFSNGEGDAWFERNRMVLDAKGRQWPLETVAKYAEEEQTVLEIGCSNGRNLSWLSDEYGCVCSGLDPSVAAISDGRRRDPRLYLEVGTADAIPFVGPFDLIILGFFLYLCDRELLPGITSSVHSLLRPGGYMAIIDFDHSVPTRLPYHHTEGVTTYKMNYSQMFLAYPQYAVVEKLSGSHAGPDFEPAPDERVSCTVLFKGATDHGYALATRDRSHNFANPTLTDEI